jgi:hypothetical protein
MTEVLSMLSVLNAYGDIVELNYKFDDKAIEELKSLSTWVKATHGKSAVNLTGPIDDLGLKDKNKHEQDQSYNENTFNCPSIKAFFDKWEKLARCRAVKIDAGSYFKMHRDAFRMNPQFRIFIPLNKTETHEWCFIYDDKLVKFKPGIPYILNTRKVHGSFSFDDDIYHVLMSLYLTEKNMETIAKMLPNCRED